MIKLLVKLANALDNAGFYEEANMIDKLAQQAVKKPIKPKAKFPTQPAAEKPFDIDKDMSPKTMRDYPDYGDVPEDVLKQIQQGQPKQEPKAPDDDIYGDSGPLNQAPPEWQRQFWQEIQRRRQQVKPKDTNPPKTQTPTKK